MPNGKIAPSGGEAKRSRLKQDLGTYIKFAVCIVILILFGFALWIAIDGSHLNEANESWLLVVLVGALIAIISFIMVVLPSVAWCLLEISSYVRLAAVLSLAALSATTHSPAAKVPKTDR